MMSFIRDQFPELLFFPTEEEREAAYEQAKKQAGHYRWYVLVCLVLTIVIRHLLKALVLARCNVSESLLDGVLWIVTVAGASYAALYLLRNRVTRSLRRQLIERGVPICFRCGYDLRGQDRPRCPECGQPFDERLLKAKPDDN